MARLEANAIAFEAKFNAAPKSKECERHPGCQAVLLECASWNAGEPVYGCAECNGEVQARRRAVRLSKVGIPGDVHHATLDNFQTNRPGVVAGTHTPEQFLDAARRFHSGEVRNLILSGTPGVGKGHLAAALAIAALDEGRSAAWITCVDLFSEYHRAYRDYSTREVVNRYGCAAITVLDEICLRELPADGHEILFAILDKRHKARRQTILLGNLPANSTKAWLGDRITDRLRSGGCILRYGEWESMRGTSLDGSGEGF